MLLKLKFAKFVVTNGEHKELILLQQWFNANKLSLNAGKTNHTFFHPPHSKDNIPLKLPALTINETEIKRETVIKFLGVLLDEHFIWKNHTKENIYQRWTSLPITVLSGRKKHKTTIFFFH